jgi:hypothetical protein
MRRGQDDIVSASRVRENPWYPRLRESKQNITFLSATGPTDWIRYGVNPETNWMWRRRVGRGLASRVLRFRTKSSQKIAHVLSVQFGHERTGKANDTSAFHGLRRLCLPRIDAYGSIAGISLTGLSLVPKS